MPIYEYQCRECGHQFEELVSIHNQVPLPCPSCNSGNTEKLLSRIGAIQMGAKPDVAPSCAGSKTPCESSGSCPVKGDCGAA